MKYGVIVETEIVDRKANVYIKYPSNQPKLTVSETSHILISGISLLVKLVEQQEGRPDYELMEEIVEHLNSEFISIKSFSDAKSFLKKEKNI